MWWRVLSVVLAFGLWAALMVPSGRILTAEDRAVAIATLPCDTRLQSTSSGFVIADQLVITVAHAIYESRDFAVRDSSGQWHDATIRHLDLERDLAVLRVVSIDATTAKMQGADTGERVRMVKGAASGSVWGQVMRRVRISTQVIGDREQQNQRSGYELSVDIDGGDSGAGVVDESGQLVGLMFARSTKRDASWATSVTELEDITTKLGGPEWTCERESDAELVLTPPSKPTRLAN